MNSNNTDLTKILDSSGNSITTTAGRLDIELPAPSRANGTITNDSASSPLSGSLGNTVATESIDMANHTKLHIYIDTSLSANSLDIQGSNDNSTWDYVEQIFSNTTTGGSFYYVFNNNGTNNYPYRYYRIINEYGSAFTFTAIRYYQE